MVTIKPHDPPPSPVFTLNCMLSLDWEVTETRGQFFYIFYYYSHHRLFQRAVNNPNPSINTVTLPLSHNTRPLSLTAFGTCSVGPPSQNPMKAIAPSPCAKAETLPGTKYTTFSVGHVFHSI